jgi:hypothetical protein
MVRLDLAPVRVGVAAVSIQGFLLVENPLPEVGLAVDDEDAVAMSDRLVDDLDDLLGLERRLKVHHVEVRHVAVKRERAVLGVDRRDAAVFAYEAAGELERAVALAGTARAHDAELEEDLGANCLAEHQSPYPAAMSIS